MDKINKWKVEMIRCTKFICMAYFDTPLKKFKSLLNIDIFSRQLNSVDNDDAHMDDTSHIANENTLCLLSRIC